MKPTTVRRVPLKHWSATEAFGFVTLVVYGFQARVLAAILWTSILRSTMTQPACIGTAWVEGVERPLWAYRGHMWVTGPSACAADVLSKGATVNPRYNADEQWWWPFVDSEFRGLMEGMDRAILGLKQDYERTWASLSQAKRRSTTATTKGIGVRDNRYIPQWVKIHVVLRDQGKCVYCGEANVKLLEFDHRHAWSKGGTSKDPVNICLGCQSCNRRKSDKDWRWW